MKNSFFFPLPLLLGVSGVVKSPFDEKQYLSFTIPDNGLAVLLISKPDLDKSSAALDVRTGYFCDPDTLPGLAHFLEHMLFLGTAKYPKENEYSQYLSENGGFSNAYTTEFDTNFYFEVASDAFAGALDRFAQFFVHPLFNADGIERELLAVDSEHKNNLQNDDWRFSQAQQSTGNPQHPFSKFGTGSSETLQNENLRDALLDFYRNHYSAHLMKLVVFGKESLESLKTMVLELFSTVPRNQHAQVDLPKSLPFDRSSRGTLTHVKAIKDIRRIEITFQISDTSSHYRASPGKYISHLIRHQGEGGILAFLKKKNWGTELSAGFEYNGLGFQIMRISIEPTAEGLEEYENVLAAVFSYLDLLLKSEIHEWIFEECRKLSQVRFTFQEDGSSSSLVSSLSAAMQMYPASDYLAGPYLLHEFRPDLIKEMISLLNYQDSVRVFVLSREYFDSVQAPVSNEKWYKTELKTVHLSFGRVADFGGEFHLPEPNPYIPDNFEVYGMKTLNRPCAPTLIDSVIWYKLDDTFLKPKVYIEFSIINMEVLESVENVMSAAIFSQVVHFELMEFSYAAYLAGVDFSIAVARDGYSISFTGFNEKIGSFIQSWCHKLANLEIEESIFEVLRDKFLDDFEDFELEEPSYISKFWLDYARSDGTWTVEEKIAALKSLTVPKLEVNKKWISDGLIQVLVHGNMREEEARFLLESFKSEIGSAKSPVQAASSSFSRVIPAGHHYFRTGTVENINSGIEVFYYSGEARNQETRCLSLLLAQILEEPFFDQLRTKEQLGYSVSCSYSECSGSVGISFSIQSEKSPEHLNHRICEFLLKQDFSMEAEKFQKHVQAMCVRLTERFKGMYEESEHYMGKISSGLADEFGSDFEDAEYMKEYVTLEQLASFAHRVLQGDGVRRLAIGVPSESLSSDASDYSGAVPEQSLISDLSEWRSNLNRVYLPLKK